MNPRPLTPREQHLIEHYSYCQLGMTPQQFYSKWNVSQEGRSLPSVLAPFPLFAAGSVGGRVTVAQLQSASVILR